MYAVIKVGGKQQRVKTGDVIEVERPKGQEPGAEITFQPILVVDDDGKTHLGKALEKASVVTTLMGNHKGDKVSVIKYKNKTRYTRHQGHRQLLTLLEVGEITLPGAPKKAAPKAEEPKAEEPKAEEPKPAKAEEPKPKAEEPKAEEPKADEAPETPVAEGEADTETEGGE